MGAKPVDRPNLLLAVAAALAAILLMTATHPSSAFGQSAGTVKQVPWELRQRFVKPKARSIRITVFGGVCGQGPDRFDHADVRFTHSTIEVSAFLFSPSPLGEVCPALAVVIPATVELPGRVRNRVIFDTFDGSRRWPPPRTAP
jgi:hypothetical protein